MQTITIWDETEPAICGYSVCSTIELTKSRLGWRIKIAQSSSDTNEEPATEQTRWIKTPDTLLAELEGFIEQIDAYCDDWCEIVEKIRPLDWITALYIAWKKGVPMQLDPDIEKTGIPKKIQQSGVEIYANWYYEYHRIKINFRKWYDFVCGGKFEYTQGKSTCDGEPVHYHWMFENRDFLVRDLENESCEVYLDGVDGTDDEPGVDGVKIADMVLPWALWQVSCNLQKAETKWRDFLGE